ncbi:MAG: hypothetical protein AB1798_21740, partial [Spirochaetota bacterium]
MNIIKKKTIQKFLLQNISSSFLLISGILVIPAFLLQRNIPIKVIQTAGYILLASLSGKPVKIVPNIIVFVFVTVINLLRPYWKVLLYLPLISITEEALELGINKAVT